MGALCEGLHLRIGMTKRQSVRATPPPPPLHPCPIPIPCTPHGPRAGTVPAPVRTISAVQVVDPVSAKTVPMSGKRMAMSAVSPTRHQPWTRHGGGIPVCVWGEGGVLGG